MTQALESSPAHITSRSHLEAGSSLYREGKLAEAAACYRRALVEDPCYAEASYNLGCAVRALAGPLEAVPHFTLAVTLAPSWGDARFNLGCTLARAGRPQEALPHLQEAARLKPHDAGVLNNLGLTLSLLDRYAEAEAAFREALRLDPNRPELHNNLAILYERVGRIGDSIDSCEAALGLRADFPEALSTLGNALKAQGRTEEAIYRYRQALSANPALTETRSSLLFALNYSAHITAEEILVEHRAFGEAHRHPLPRHDNSPDPARPLRLGYVSADFKDHAVSRFLEPVLEHHDKGRFRVFCYSNVATPDGGTSRLRGLADCWREICGLGDEAAAALIREDGIDILIDLAGHTAGNRLPLFALKPAPLQVTWIGYPQTTGLAAIDYRITDAVADPPGTTEHLHTEELLRLPGTFSCFKPLPDAPPVGAPPLLSSGVVTFGSFNNPAKITTETVSLWSAVLRALPASRMLIKGYSLADPRSRARLAALFQAQGVSPSRLTMRGNTVSYREHLELYRGVDIALDSFPYHGTTTTCEALWMGVPVITLAGREHRSRVGVTLLNAVGLAELAVTSPEQFLNAAAGLARDRERLAGLRARLRQMMAQSTLTDAASFTRNLEGALGGIWEKWCQGKREPAPPVAEIAAEAAPPADLLTEGKTWLAHGYLDQALASFVAILKESPSSPEALAAVEQTLNYQRTRELNEALNRDALRVGAPPIPIEDQPIAAETLAEAAGCLLRRGMLTAGELLCREALERNPHGADVYRTLGGIARELGEDGPAATCYRKARELGDRSVATGIALAKAEEGASCRRAENHTERFLAIKAWGFGFWSDIAHLMGGLLLAEITGRTPVVHWGGNSLFSDDPTGNAFERFFEPVAPVTLPGLAASGRTFYPAKWHAGNLLHDRVNTFDGPDSRFSALRALQRTEEVVVSDFHFSVHDLVPWIRPGHWLYGMETDRVCRALFDRYLRVRPEILAEAEVFRRARMQGRTLLAVHVRGGDKGGEDPNLARLNSLYAPYIARFLAKAPEAGIFLITDDESMLEQYRERYGERLIFGEATRTSTEQGVHYQQGQSRHRLGVEVLVDVLLALSCHSFIGNGFSNVSCAVAQLKEWQEGTLTLLGARLDRVRRVTMYRS